MMKLKVLWLPMMLVLFSGCELMVPFFNMYHESGVSEADRKLLLKPQVKAFVDALRTNDIDKALMCIDDEHPEVREALLQDLKRARRKEVVVSSETELVLFSDTSHKAAVEVLVKYYEIPYYIVNEREEKQDWVFTLHNKWKLVSLRIEKIKETN
jgi:hypothetical protein